MHYYYFVLLQVHICTSFILNGVCVRWRGWLDLERLEGAGSLELDEELAKREEAVLNRHIQLVHQKIRDCEDRYRSAADLQVQWYIVHTAEHLFPGISAYLFFAPCVSHSISCFFYLYLYPALSHFISCSPYLCLNLALSLCIASSTCISTSLAVSHLTSIFSLLYLCTSMSLPHIIYIIKSIYMSRSI